MPFKEESPNPINITYIEGLSRALGTDNLSWWVGSFDAGESPQSRRNSESRQEQLSVTSYRDLERDSDRLYPVEKHSESAISGIFNKFTGYLHGEDID